MAVNSTPFTTPLGTPLPEVTLPDVDGHLVPVRTESEPGLPILVFFGCNHCPYVRHIELQLGDLLRNYLGDLAVFAISSNDVAQYPDDDARGLKSQQRRARWEFPYLIDEDQSAAKAFNAACTPDFFLFDKHSQLAYRGAFDASSPKNGEPVTGELLRTAIDDVVAGVPVPEPHRPSLGCGIKWKPGNEPPAVVYS